MSAHWRNTHNVKAINAECDLIIANNSVMQIVLPTINMSDAGYSNLMHITTHIFTNASRDLKYMSSWGSLLRYSSVNTTATTTTFNEKYSIVHQCSGQIMALFNY